jgi:hypothetical protein
VPIQGDRPRRAYLRAQGQRDRPSHSRPRPGREGSGITRPLWSGAPKFYNAQSHSTWAWRVVALTGRRLGTPMSSRRRPALPMVQACAGAHGMLRRRLCTWTAATSDRTTPAG